MGLKRAMQERRRVKFEELRIDGQTGVKDSASPLDQALPPMNFLLIQQWPFAF